MSHSSAIISPLNNGYVATVDMNQSYTSGALNTYCVNNPTANNNVNIHDGSGTALISTGGGYLNVKSLTCDSSANAVLSSGGAMNVYVTNTAQNANQSVNLCDGTGIYLTSTNHELNCNISSGSIANTGFNVNNFPSSQNVNIHDGSGNNITSSNPLYVQFGNSPTGTAIVSGTLQYTTTQTQSDVANTGQYRGINIYLNVSAYTDSNLNLEIDGKDPVSGTYYSIFSGPVVASVSFHRYVVYPTLTASVGAVANDVLPAIWRINVTVSGATSGATWGVGYDLVR